MASLLNVRGGALMNTFTPQRDYSLEYFTIESLADSNTISIYNKNCNTLPTFYYSTDNGATWNSITAEKGKTKSVATINTGDKILFKCTQDALSTDWDTYNGFKAGKSYKVYGNAMSLLYGDTFASNSEFSNNSKYNFAALFRDNTTLTDAENLILPALIAKEGCYNGTFRGCTNLAHGPQLPTVTPENSCFASMFEGCVNLEEAPEINIDLDQQDEKKIGGALNRMFCMSRTTTVTAKMTKSPVIRSSRIPNGKSMNNNANDALNEMFKGNGSLVEVTCLATSLGNRPPTMNWLLNVSPTGTFYKAAGMNDWPTGVNGIPSGWTVVDYVESLRFTV